MKRTCKIVIMGKLLGLCGASHPLYHANNLSKLSTCRRTKESSQKGGVDIMGVNIGNKEELGV